jgi:hypothetical protein
VGRSFEDMHGRHSTGALGQASDQAVVRGRPRGCARRPPARPPLPRTPAPLPATSELTAPLTLPPRLPLRAQYLRGPPGHGLQQAHVHLEPFRAPAAGSTCILATYGDIHLLDAGPGIAGSAASAASAASAGSGALPIAGLSPAAASSLQQQLGSAAFSAAAAPMVVLDTSRPGLPVVYHNRAFGQLLQLPPGAPAALAGRPWSLLHCADTDAEAAEQLEAELRAGHAASAELLCASTTGRRFWASLASCFLYNSAGAATPYAVLVASNLTAAKTAEAAHLLRDHALSNLREGITIADPNLPDTPIVFVNQAFLAMTGYSREEVLGRNCRCAGARRGRLAHGCWAGSRGGAPQRGPLPGAGSGGGGSSGGGSSGSSGNGSSLTAVRSLTVDAPRPPQVPAGPRDRLRHRRRHPRRDPPAPARHRGDPQLHARG